MSCRSIMSVFGAEFQAACVTGRDCTLVLLWLWLSGRDGVGCTPGSSAAARAGRPCPCWDGGRRGCIDPAVDGREDADADRL